MESVWLVSVIKDVYEAECGIEIAGIFTTKEKAYEAKAKITEYLEDEEYEDYDIFVIEYDSKELDMLRWYEINEKM